jgi:putative heme iron utilization protein
MKYKEILAATRVYEQRSTEARKRFEETGDATYLDKITECEQALDKLAQTDPEDK